jgi:uncharacterized YigZ family protein
MLFDDTYKTISKKSEGIFKDKGSKFIAYAFPVRTEEEIKTGLAEIRKEHPSARHHCYAYRLGADKLIYRINDDGEPSGSAGRPIYNQILSNDLTNILIVVVRYFGGTLLGVPGLINAYKTAVVEALHHTQIITEIVYETYHLEFDYIQMNEVMKIIKDHQLQIIKQEADVRCSFMIAIRKSKSNEIISLLLKTGNVKLIADSY